MMSVKDIFTSRSQRKSDTQWTSISDLMSGLMIIFLFVAIAYMRDVVVQKERVEEVAIMWNNTQEALYLDLYSEFKGDLDKWQASINKDTLSVRFEEPTVLFEAGSSNLSNGFKAILNDFFPRYINILNKYRDSIAEVRIEGHTSSEWIGTKHGLEAYFRNMELSQNRTRSVLQHCLMLPAVARDVDWTRKNITANGLSSSNPIVGADGEEDSVLSRRVEFRVRTDAERRIVTILEGIK